MAKLFERHGKMIVMDRRGAHDFDGKCEMCGKADELRPYGPNGANICFPCAMKDEEGTSRRFAQMLNGQA